MRVEAGTHQWPMGRCGVSLAKKVATLDVGTGLHDISGRSLSWLVDP